MPTTSSQRLVAALLALHGVSVLFYADVTPELPVIEQRVPAAWWALGLAGIVAAVGVLRRADWGRVLGIVFVTLVLIAQMLPGIWSSIAVGAAGVAAVLIWAVYLAMFAFILFELLRRWPFMVRPDQ